MTADIAALETIRAEEEYVGIRARFRALLGNARIAVQLDIGAGDAVAIEAKEVTVPTLLPGMPAPRLHAYPREVAVPEKFEAMVKLDTRNSPMKDFHDVWAISDAFAFDGARLQRAVAACFERRAVAWTAEPPGALTKTSTGLRRSSAGGKAASLPAPCWSRRSGSSSSASALPRFFDPCATASWRARCSRASGLRRGRGGPNL